MQLTKNLLVVLTITLFSTPEWQIVYVSIVLCSYGVAVVSFRPFLGLATWAAL